MKTLTTGQIAKYCGVHYRTVNRWIAKDYLHAFKLPGRGDNRVEQDEFIAFMEKNNMPIPDDLMHSQILIIDDDSNLIEFIKRALHKKKFMINEAIDGLQAGAILASTTPSVVILDINLPYLNGFEVLKYIQSDKKFKHTKVLAITGEDSALAKKMLAKGAHAYLLKPFDQEKLINKIETLLNA